MSCFVLTVQLVSLREDRLQRFVESEIMRPPPGAELEKAVIEPADITIRRSSDVSDMQLALNSAVGECLCHQRSYAC